MKMFFTAIAILSLVLGLVACQNNPVSVTDSVNATATAQAMFERIPSDIPVMKGAYELRVSSSGNSVSYRIKAVFEDVIKFYQEQSLVMGWEQLGGEQIMSDSITMQRTKPDKNMSILISAIQDSGEVLVVVMTASN